MKVSLLWLREFVDVPEENPHCIGEKLTLHTCELEEVVSLQNQFKHCVTGKVLDIVDHPHSETLKKAVVDTHTHGLRSILFGESLPLQKEMIVFVALEGAILPNGMKIEKRTMGGEISEGMICVGTEIGFKTDALITFPSDTPLGIPVYEAEPLFADTLLDIDNKSLTHRPDMWGVHGFARELSALYNVKKNIPFYSVPTEINNTSLDPFPVRIDTDYCHRFCAVSLSNVCNDVSDLRTTVRLETLGVRSISSLVDITNLILLEYGQPMHVFDASKIQGGITVRQAQKGETLLALDGETYQLEPSDIVIADDEKVLSIAGIMGGMHSSVTKDTTSIVFESAHFDPVRIRKTSARLGLRSESSMRFEKTLDPNNCMPALLKALAFLEKQCPNKVFTSSIADHYPKPFPNIDIHISPDKVRLVSGIADITDDEMMQILSRLDFEGTKTQKGFHVQVPSFRATKDIALEEDIIEEIVRLYGFDRVPSKLPSLPVRVPTPYPLRSLEWKLRDFWSLSGFLEVFQYSFANQADKDFSENGDEFVSIKNPLSSQQAFLRTNLVSNMIKNLESELRTHKSIAFFEIGRVFLNQTNTSPREEPRLCVFMADMQKDETDMFFDLRSHLDSLASFVSQEFEFEPSKTPLPYAHPNKHARIVCQDVHIGDLFCIHPQKHSIQNASLVCAEIQLEPLLSTLSSPQKKYVPISAYPVFLRDISILVPSRTHMRDVVKVIRSSSSYIQDIQLFDEFEDETHIGKNIKNLSFHLTFGSSQKTLRDTEVESDFESIVSALSKNLSAQLRGKTS